MRASATDPIVRAMPARDGKATGSASARRIVRGATRTGPATAGRTGIAARSIATATAHPIVVLAQASCGVTSAPALASSGAARAPIGTTHGHPPPAKRRARPRALNATHRLAVTRSWSENSAAPPGRGLIPAIATECVQALAASARSVPDRQHLDIDFLSEPASELTGAAGVDGEFLAPDP